MFNQELELTHNASFSIHSQSYEWPCLQRKVKSFYISPGDLNKAYIDLWVQESGDWLVGGDLSVLGRVTWGDGLDQYRQAQYLAIMGHGGVK